MCREKAVAGDLVPLVTAHSRGGRPHHLRGPGVLGSPGGRTGWRGPRPRLGMVGWHVPSASGLERPVGRGQREATVGTSPYHPDWTGCGTQNTCLGASSGRARWWPGGSFPTPPPTPPSTHPPTARKQRHRQSGVACAGPGTVRAAQGSWRQSLGVWGCLAGGTGQGGALDPQQLSNPGAQDRAQALRAAGETREPASAQCRAHSLTGQRPGLCWSHCRRR